MLYKARVDKRIYNKKWHWINKHPMPFLFYKLITTDLILVIDSIE